LLYYSIVDKDLQPLPFSFRLLFCSCRQNTLKKNIYQGAVKRGRKQEILWFRLIRGLKVLLSPSLSLSLLFTRPARGHTFHTPFVLQIILFFDSSSVTLCKTSKLHLFFPNSAFLLLFFLKLISADYISTAGNENTKIVTAIPRFH